MADAQRFRGAIVVGKGFLERGDSFAAFGAFKRASCLAANDDERELAHGLAHLAAAAHRHQLDDPAAARRQLCHAERRLTSDARKAITVDVEPLIVLVDTFVNSGG